MTDLSRYTIGWICAIDTEYTAARAFLDETHERPEAIPVHDNNAYTLGRIGKHNVVIAVLPDGEYGLSTAGIVAQRMLGSFPNVRVGLMVGIGGGAPIQRPGHDIRLGDVVVSSPRDGHTGVLQYDFGKTIQNQGFKITRSLNLPPDVLRAAVTELRVTFEEEGSSLPEAIDVALSKKPKLRRKYGRPPPETDRLLLSHVVHDPTNPIETPEPDVLVSRSERGEDEDNPAVFYGLIASANQLMKDANVRDRYAAEEDVLCFEMEAAGLMNHFPCLVIRGICDYSDSHKNKQWQGYAAMAAAAYAKALLSIVLPTKIENEKRLADIVESGLQDVVDATARMSRRVDDEVLNHLTMAKGAAYDSGDDQHEDTCLPGTRAELLKSITQWAQDPEEQKIYWLKGMAGTGKSTICRSFATTCAEEKILGASFFFKRGESDRSSAGLFFSTIARQLVNKRQDLCQPMIAAIKKDQEISSKSMVEQFRRLLEEPLQRSLPQPHESSKILIIDALDECTDDRDVKGLVVLLSKLTERKQFGLKVFITSRPDVAAEFAFGSIDGLYQEIILQEVEKNVIDHDIGTYMNVTLSAIRDQWNRSTRGKASSIPADWPGQEVLEILIQHARPLFIFAATACRFVQDYRRGNPQEQLGYFLQAIEDQEVGGTMYATYFPILQNFMKGGGGFKRQDSRHLESFRQIIGTIVLLEQPMCAESLSQLIKVKTADVTRITDLLRSVFDISGAHDQTIKLFHLSFRDFLVSPESGKFNINSREAHAKIALDCIDLLSSGGSLHYNVAGLRPGDQFSKLDNQVVQRKFPPHVRYACIHLVDHLKESEVPLRDGDNLHQFLQLNMLFWIEALVVLGKSSMVVATIDNLISLVETSFRRELTQVLEDIKLFVLSYIATFAEYPLQLYWSALLFSPRESLTRKTFASCLPSAVNLISPGASGWPQLRIINGQEFGLYVVVSMAVSPDSRLLACGDADGRLSIWSLPTGKIMHELSTWELHEQNMRGCIGNPELMPQPTIVSLVFSANSEQLVVASSRYFYVYNTSTGVLVRSFGSEGMRTTHTDAPHGLSHSVDFASAHPEGALGMWSVSTGKPHRWLEIPGLKRVCSSPKEDFGTRDGGRERTKIPHLRAAVGFSRDSKLISGYFQTTNATHVWSVAQGHHLYRFESGSTDHFEKAFWYSSMIPSIVRNNDKVDVLEITLEDDKDEASHNIINIRRLEYAAPPANNGWRGRGQIAVSQDNRYAAFRASNRVTVWSLPDAKMVKRIEIELIADHGVDHERSRPQPDLRFSGDGQYLVLAGMTYIAIWSMSALTGDTTQVLRENLQPRVNATSRIYDSTDDLVATDSAGSLVTVWSTTNGHLMRKFDEPTSEVVSFSTSSASSCPPPVRSFIKQACFSPNGRYLFLEYEDGLHYVQCVDSEFGFTINTNLLVSASAPRRGYDRQKPGTHFFSPDSVSIGVCGPHGIVLYELSTGKRLWRNPTGEPPIAVSLDGKTLIHCAASPENHTETSIIRCSMANEKRTEVHRFTSEDSVLKFSPDFSWTLFKRQAPSADEIDSSQHSSSASQEINCELMLLHNDDKSRFRHFRYKGREKLSDTAFSEDSSRFAESHYVLNGYHRVRIWSLRTCPIVLLVEIDPLRTFHSINLYGSSLLLDMSERKGCIEYAGEIGRENELIRPEVLSREDEGFHFDESREWIVHNNCNIIRIPKVLKVKAWGGKWGKDYSRTGEGHVAWIARTGELWTIRLSG